MNNEYLESKEYQEPIVKTEQLFNISSGDVSVFGRCWGLATPTPDGSFSHAAGGCKD